MGQAMHVLPRRVITANTNIIRMLEITATMYSSLVKLTVKMSKPFRKSKTGSIHVFESDMAIAMYSKS